MHRTREGGAASAGLASAALQPCVQLSRFAKLNADWSGENAEFTRVVVLGTCTGTVLDLYLSTIFKYLYWYWYLEPKYWYLYWYLND